MSNRPRPRAETSETVLDAVVAEIGDRQIPGGCDDCPAYQTMRKMPGGWYDLHTWHDPACPWLLACYREQESAS